MKKNVVIISILLILLVTTSCDPYEKLSKERAQKAAALENDITIGIIDTSINHTFMVEGINLAIEHLNKQGGVLGKKIIPIYYDDKGSVTQGQKVAKKIARNTDIIAAVGHIDAGIAIPASITYEKTGVLFISPKATNPELTRYNHKYIFRNIPSDMIAAQKIASFAKRRGYKKIAIIFDRDSYMERLAKGFYKCAVDAKINIAVQKSYSGWESDFKQLIFEIIKEKEFDCIFLAGVRPSAAHMVKQMREMGIKTPIIGSDNLDSNRLIEIAGNAAEGVITYSVFNPSLPEPPTMNFVKAFKTKYGVIPDTYAAQGYDAIKVLAYCIQKSGTATPIAIASIMRLLKNWKSVTGSYSFEDSGTISDKAFFFKIVESGNFKFLERELTQKINILNPIEETTIRIPIQKKINTLDPGHAVESNSIDIVEQLFLGLTDLDPETYQAVPELAKSWTVSEDGLTYRFFMREDTKWTNGEPVTAHDIVWTIRRNIKPETNCPNANLLYILKNGADIHKGGIKESFKIGVHAIDDFIIEFQLERPDLYFPAIAGLPIYRPLPRKTIERYKDEGTDPKTIQTNGPYELAEWKKGLVTILKKSKGYYDAEKVSIPEIRYYVVQEPSVGLAMYYNNKLDIIGGNYLKIPAEELLAIRANKDLSQQYYRKLLLSTYAYAFNIKNLLVRKAITACINRKLIIQLVTKQDEEPAMTFISPVLSGINGFKEGIGIKFDPVQAKKWFTQAEYPNDEEFSEITLCYGISEKDLEIAKAIQAFLKHYLNINVKLVSENRINNTRSSDIVLLKTRGINPLKSLEQTDLNVPYFNRLIVKAFEETDPEIKKKLYKEAEEILCEKKCAVAPIYHDTVHYLVKPRIKGWYHMNIGGQHISNWSFK